MNQKKQPIENELRPTSAMRDAHEALRTAVTGQEVLHAIYEVLSAFCTKRYTAILFDQRTGKPLEYAWKVQKRKLMQFIYFPTYHNEIKFTEQAKVLLNSLVDEAGDKQVLFKIKVDGKVRYLTVDTDNISTGGGHNDSPTFVEALVFKIAHLQVNSLCPTKQQES